MKTRLLAAIGACAAVVAPAAASAACASFEASPAELTVQYDPFGRATVDRVFTLRIRRLDPAATGVRFVFANPDASGGRSRVGRYGPEDFTILWNRDQGRRVFVLGAEQPNPTNGAYVQFAAAPAGNVVTDVFRLQLPPGQQAAAGTYLQPMELRFFCTTAGDSTPPDFQTGSQVAVQVEVPQRISSYIGSIGQRRGAIDFGELGAGGGVAPRSLAVTVQATVPYTIDIHKERRALRRSDEDSYGIPYRMRLSGVEVDDGSRMACDVTQAPTGRVHPVEVALSQRDVASVPAGSYSDTVTLTFLPRLGLAGGAGCAIGG
ncbi:hypothetical protein LZK98_06725 [Sphingomonas cannabina]|uniref:hypothetical protein n=1 Tax=Sphingomonas cannabina TaxID=2899123 RepID=UPI001F3FF93F|nr:hypothetical protein [Sphingomonas cannabina]UIJ46635.1 hypothetical protein LZK98_06725 [Sphingomonas cannabina]